MDTTALLARIEGLLDQGQMSPSRFGRDVANDPRLVFDLRRGRRLMMKSRSRVSAFLDQLSTQNRGRAS